MGLGKEIRYVILKPATWEWKVLEWRADLDMIPPLGGDLRVPRTQEKGS